MRHVRQPRRKKLREAQGRAMSETDQLRTKKINKEKNAVASPFLREMFQGGLYKRSQGRIARQITFAALAILFGLGAWRMSSYMQDTLLIERGAIAIPSVLGAIGIWFAYRLVNVPSFADFLIAVEAEMNKVSWPTRPELIRSSLVVILLIGFLVGILFVYDVFWRELLQLLGVIRGGK